MELIWAIIVDAGRGGPVGLFFCITFGLLIAGCAWAEIAVRLDLARIRRNVALAQAQARAQAQPEITQALLDWVERP